MKPRHFRIIGTLSAFIATGALFISPEAGALSAEVEAAQDVEVLTRGPVHEAFAESVSFDPQPGMIIRSAPPENIEELPPEQQLEGDNVTWIPGYWAWDDDRGDFIWISGIWRNLPPERQWVPGYWDALEGGEYQWTSGYWSDAEETEVAYIPTAPPRSVDIGPNIEAPSEDHTWIPGNWVYGESRYAWRPGYWNPLRPNWTWVPSRYNWTRRGYVYIDGYWDYAVAGRGVVFAPVYFNRHVYSSPDYYYTPSIVVSLDVFASHLFIRPRCGHYYFGDYYAPRYRDSGFYASFSWHSGGRGYDPIYAYNRWDHRHEDNWDRHQQDNYNYFRDNDRFRPPHTWSAMQRLRGESFEDDRGRSRVFANSFDGMVKNPERGQRFRTLDKDRRTEFVTQGKEMRKFGQERRQSEARGIVAADASKKMVTREKIARSPFVGRSSEKFTKEKAPPVRPEPRGSVMRERLQARKAENANPSPAEIAKPTRESVRPGTTREIPGKGPETANDRKVNPVPQTREAPQRQPQVTPERKVQPQTREKPERKPMVTPERKVQPQTREVPQRQPQVTPERKVQPRTREVPQRQPQVTPERKAQPRTREVPERQPQVTPERKVQPQTREVPQRQPQVQPQRQIQPQRQPQVQPQRQIQPQRQPQVQPQRQIQPRERSNEKGSRGRPDA
jgi:hypothetical protein